MTNLDLCYCPNESCSKYGKDGSRDLLYCRTCGTRFAATRASALFGLHLPDNVIRQIIHYAAEGVGVRATARLQASRQRCRETRDSQIWRALRKSTLRAIALTETDRSPTG